MEYPLLFITVTDKTTREIQKACMTYSSRPLLGKHWNTMESPQMGALRDGTPTATVQSRVHRIGTPEGCFGERRQTATESDKLQISEELHRA